MKVKNKRMRGGRQPLLICPCNNPQSAGPPRPVAGFGRERMLYCASDCGVYNSLKR